MKNITSVLFLLIVSACASNPVLNLKSENSKIQVYRDSTDFNHIRSVMVPIKDIEVKAREFGKNQASDSATTKLYQEAQLIDAKTVFIHDAVDEYNLLTAKHEVTIRATAYKDKEIK